MADDGRAAMMGLYAKGKEMQWDAANRIDWSQSLDEDNPEQMPEESLPIHMADMGTDNYEQEFTLGLVEKDRNLLREINNALAKIQNGTFGTCVYCGGETSQRRLDAVPWTPFCIRCQEAADLGERVFSAVSSNPSWARRDHLAGAHFAVRSA